MGNITGRTLGRTMVLFVPTWVPERPPSEGRLRHCSRAEGTRAVRTHDGKRMWWDGRAGAALGDAPHGGRRAVVGAYGPLRGKRYVRYASRRCAMLSTVTVTTRALIV